MRGLDGALVLAQMPSEDHNRVEDTFLREQVRHLREADMHGNQREAKLAAREHHSPIARAPNFRHHLAMPGKMMPGAIPPLLADGRGYQRVDMSIASHSRAGFDVAKGGVAAFDTGLAGPPRFAVKAMRQWQHRQSTHANGKRFARDAIRNPGVGESSIRFGRLTPSHRGSPIAMNRGASPRRSNEAIDLSTTSRTDARGIASMLIREELALSRAHGDAET